MENQDYSANMAISKDGSYVVSIYYENKLLIKKHKAKDAIEASIWLDDEMSRLTIGKGVWDE